ncbi:hypothetical protein KL924_004787 [Ogataea haglerorum]|nr:hypothetical protein KL947_003502 [Ogataea haglerorum]KAG7805370.1 hypothetical protein KL924_004787 [Ogataea haglerorum]
MGDLNKHTFLSRVFGSASNPLLNDDNNDIEFSINNLQDTLEEHEVESPPRAPHAINVNSEDESSSETESASNDDLLYDQKRHLYQQVESELRQEDYDTVPESLMMERRRPHEGSTRAFGTKKSPSPAERQIGLDFSQWGEKAKGIASRTIDNIPKAIPRGISFQLPTSASSKLPPPPLSYRREASVGGEPEVVRNINEQRQLRGRLGLLSPMERALWLWSNVSNLDTFLEDVYGYYTGNGYRCIILSRVSDLLIIVFVVWLSSFMGNCVDYNRLMNGSASRYSDVVVDRCYSKISFSQKFFFFVLFIILVLRVKSFYNHFKDLKEIKNFYNLLLGVSDEELQTISWSTIVKKIMVLRDQNTNALISGNQNIGGDDLKSKKRLSAHDIANRLMRKENYMIAIFNKNVLAPALTVPLINHHFLTKTLEWNLKLCIFDFMFNSDGQLKHAVLSEHKRLALATELRKRFRLAGILSIFLTPFLVIYFLLYFFLKFFYDIKTNPSLVGSREYSPYARWKLREFNELPHMFDKRLKMSRARATEYINQFPKEATNIVLNFVAFVTGSLVTILVVLTVLGHENFLNFELTEGRTVLFYISTLGAIFTICKGSVSENDTVFDPEASLRYVAQFTHYLPSSWNGRFHTEEVKNEFCNLFNLRLILVLKEITSLIMLPYILYCRLPDVSEKVIDFFREFSVHVDGLGYVCTFAMFEFDSKDKPIRSQTSKDYDDVKQGYYTADDDKMVKSYLYFLESYGNEPVRKTGKEPTVDRIGSRRPGQKHLLRSAMMNNSMMDKNRGAHSTARYPPQFRSPNLGESIYAKPQNIDLMEDTTAGLSTDTRNYLQTLNNSTFLGESFQHGFPVEDTSRHDEDADSEDDDEAGVLGLINQIYKHKEGVN